tara:strand:+ start:1532 stop:2992 length:1461 start_codon:yes stop_codon:yes gene_type:complete
LVVALIILFVALQKAELGDQVLIVYRLSAVDLIHGGMSGDETVELARQIEKAGTDIINTGVGWHESRTPTVAHFVPRAGWSYAIGKISEAVACPVVASNRINDPKVANDLIADKKCALVSMARPLLADPDFMRKARQSRPEAINTCIACNQACLDRGFRHESVSCLVNPRGARETDFIIRPSDTPKRIAVVGAGAAGMNFAFNAAARGHAVTLYEAGDDVGGQLLMARVIPDKSEFNEMLRYFRQRLVDTKVKLVFNTKPDAQFLANEAYDDIIIATGVVPRQITLTGMDHPNVLDYVDVLRRGQPVGKKVVIIGGGGIAFDIAEYLLGEPCYEPQINHFAQEYGLDLSLKAQGGLLAAPTPEPAKRNLTILKRSEGKPTGNRKAVTTNWIKRDRLRSAGVKMFGGITYIKIDERGLHGIIKGHATFFAADTIIICAGQVSERSLHEQLISDSSGTNIHVIGGADQANELDAMSAIEQATRLALSI